MFDTNQIAKKIKQARIDKNMTQMNLADAMGVSYQAVSNWERGNSMPDISKLAELCAALDISINELLGAEEKSTEVVDKAVKKVELSMEELSVVAPMLLPSQVKEQVNRQKKKQKFDLSRIADLAPFLEDDSLAELVLEAIEESIDGIDEIACYLNKETLEKVVEKAKTEELEELTEIACYLEDAALDQLVRRFEAATMFDLIEEIACYLSEKTLDGFVDRLIAGDGFYEELSELYCYMDDKTLKKLSKHLMGKRDLDALEDLWSYV